MLREHATSMLPFVRESGDAISCAELAWAARDASDAGLPDNLLPSPRHPPTQAAPMPPETALAGASAEEQRDGALQSETAATSTVSSTALSSQLELQRALTHPQLSRSWVGLGRSEAQIETGTTVVPLEVLQWRVARVHLGEEGLAGLSYTISAPADEEQADQARQADADPPEVAQTLEGKAGR